MLGQLLQQTIGMMGATSNSPGEKESVIQHDIMIVEERLFSFELCDRRGLAYLINAILKQMWILFCMIY